MKEVTFLPNSENGTSVHLTKDRNMHSNPERSLLVLKLRRKDLSNVAGCH